MIMSMKIVKVKDRYGILLIPARVISQTGHESLNHVLFEDGTKAAVRSEEMEVVDDWPEEVEE